MFKLITKEQVEIKFKCYFNEAPQTVKAFLSCLPIQKTFYHARVSGQEIWFDNFLAFDCIQENASVYTEPGEVVLGPSKPMRNKTAGCFGIYYGEGKGLDACNIFARVFEEDRGKLVELGNKIWKEGALDISIQAL